MSEPEPLSLSKKETSIKRWIWICGVAAFVLVTFGVIAWWIGHRKFFGTGNPSLGDWGNYGSFLQGTTASLWSLAGLLIIFVAFLAQKQQLLRQELELQKQAKQFELQQQSIKLQNFENSFFQLLSLHNQIVTSMRGTSMMSRDESFGRACFEKWYDDFKTVRWSNPKNAAPVDVPVLKRYSWLYDMHQGELGHYFRNLYHVIKFVKESEALKNDNPIIEYKNRRRYTSLVRATLSQFELALLFYNGISDNGDKFKPLIEEFGLLENFDRDVLYNKPEDEKLYDTKAFQ
jgi:hypothetical protein